MRIVCVGGGPAGLYFGLLMKKLHPEHAITVVERNQPYDTFGWGVVFSDATMAAMRIWDPESAAEIETAFNQDAGGDLDFPEADLVVASDGLNSKIRNRYADVFQPDLVVRPN